MVILVAPVDTVNGRASGEGPPAYVTVSLKSTTCGQGTVLPTVNRKGLVLGAAALDTGKFGYAEASGSVMVMPGVVVVRIADSAVASATPRFFSEMTSFAPSP